VSEIQVEATGETVGEAKWKALRELQRLAPSLDRETVRYQVVSEGERGLLGVGYTPARVVATAVRPAGDVPAPAQPPPDESQLAARVRAIVETVIAALGAGARVDVQETDDEILVTCSGGDLGIVIGKHGQTIDALQYVTNAALRGGERKAVTIDAAGYRDRRRAVLESIALRAAERAARGERVRLDPMTPVERKVVHERLKDVEGVVTTSEGTEPNRHVVVLPE
jgi:spoIIIJ-associated protein